MAPTLLPFAWLHALAGEWDTARQRLDEALALATRNDNAQNRWQGGMRLHLVDTLLHRARLFGWPNEEARVSLARPHPGGGSRRSRGLIDACGYHRRDQELADARAALS